MHCGVLDGSVKCWLKIMERVLLVSECELLYRLEEKGQIAAQRSG